MPPPSKSQALDQAHRLRRQQQRQTLFDTEQELLRLKERLKFKKDKATAISKTEPSNDPQELSHSPKAQEQTLSS
jgi:hypothetical protein